MGKFTEVVKANKKTIIKRVVIGAAIVTTVVVVSAVLKAADTSEYVVLEVPTAE